MYPSMPASTQTSPRPTTASSPVDPSGSQLLPHSHPTKDRPAGYLKSPAIPPAVCIHLLHGGTATPPTPVTHSRDAICLTDSFRDAYFLAPISRHIRSVDAGSTSWLQGSTVRLQYHEGEDPYGTHRCRHILPVVHPEASMLSPPYCELDESKVGKPLLTSPCSRATYHDAVQPPQTQ